MDYEELLRLSYREERPEPVGEELWVHRSSGLKVRVWLSKDRKVVAYQVEDGIVRRDSGLRQLRRGSGDRFDVDLYFETPSGKHPKRHFDDWADRELTRTLERPSDWRMWWQNEVFSRAMHRLMEEWTHPSPKNR